MLSEAALRLRATNRYLEEYAITQQIVDAESAILQLRKALEYIAFSSIAPNKKEYELFRASADMRTDYKKDYHAGKILQALGKINEDFYPYPLLSATHQQNGSFHFDRKTTGYLTKKRFASTYDRIGKYLHADNPWSVDKNFPSFVTEIPSIIHDVFGLIECHAVFIKTPEFNGVWVVEVLKDGSPPRIITGVADGDFFIEKM
ncbi:hypothetical protein CSQ88_07285 [Iodobacter sp. BJB302]|nr:hypothetical protein CSQ88_07285 [Iodobacter sp. BJB302]